MSLYKCMSREQAEIDEGRKRGSEAKEKSSKRQRIGKNEAKEKFKKKRKGPAKKELHKGCKRSRD